MRQFPAYILAGGKSERFGSDKARAVLEGKPLVVRVAESLMPIASSVTVVAREDDQYGDLELRTVGDLQPGLGPMGGLLTALTLDAGPWVLIAACDLVGIQRAWLESLAKN